MWTTRTRASPSRSWTGGRTCSKPLTPLPLHLPCSLSLAHPLPHHTSPLSHRWEDLFEAPNTTAVLQAWRTQLAPYYDEGSALRNKTLERLSTRYWSDLFNLRLDDYVRKEKETEKETEKERERARSRKRRNREEEAGVG
jgi:hypothetical protein